METKAWVHAYLPVRVPPAHWPSWRQAHEEALEELLSYDQQFIIGKHKDIRLGICEVQNAAIGKVEFDRRQSNVRTIRFTAEMDIDPDAGTGDMQELSPENRREIARSLAATYMGKTVCDLVLLSQIAKPGAITTLRGVVVVEGGRDDRIRPFTTALRVELDDSHTRFGWPEVDAIPLMDVWRWAIDLPGFADGMGSCPAGRALASLSHYMKKGDLNATPADLVWLLIGLEALYCIGSTGLRAQLVQKAQLVLGSPQIHKKQFGAVYDFRSRFLHGDLDFPMEYCPYDAMDSYSAFDSESYDGRILAAAVLIATLQRMVRLNVTDLEFEYRLVTEPG